MAMYKCTGCEYEKAVPEQLAGKRVKCPKCQAVNEVRPGGAPQPAAPKAAPQPAAATKPATAVRPAIPQTAPKAAPLRAGTEKPAVQPATAKPVIKFVCPLCDQKLGVPAEYAGKRVRCNKCKNPVDVPAASQAAAAPAPKPASPPPAPKPVSTPASKPASLGTDETDFMLEPLGGIGELLDMEQQSSAAERPAAAAPRVQPVDAAVPEVRQTAARPAAAGPAAAGKSGSKGGLVMAATAVGAVCSLVTLAGIVLFLITPPPQTDYGPAERFVQQFMGRSTSDQGESEGEAETPATTGEPNAPQPDEATITNSERSHFKRPKAASISGMESYGPELMGEMTKEAQVLAEYMNNHQDDASAGAMERLGPMTSAMSDFSGVIWREPTLMLVRKAQCYLPDSRQFGYSMTYRPRSSGDMDQQVVFILESKAGGFMLQGTRAKLTLKGWVDALPPRATMIDAKTDSLDMARRLEAMPKAYWMAGIPAMSVLAVILVVSLWVLFEKFGHMGTGVLVPVYNLWALAEVGGRPGWLSLLVVAAIGLTPMFGGTTLYAGAAICAAIMLVISLGVASECNKSPLWGVGAWLLPGAFYPLMAASVKGD